MSFLRSPIGTWSAARSVSASPPSFLTWSCPAPLDVPRRRRELEEEEEPRLPSLQLQRAARQSQNFSHTFLDWRQDSPTPRPGPPPRGVGPREVSLRWRNVGKAVGCCCWELREGQPKARRFPCSWPSAGGCASDTPTALCRLPWCRLRTWTILRGPKFGSRNEERAGVRAALCLGLPRLVPSQDTESAQPCAEQTTPSDWFGAARLARCGAQQNGSEVNKIRLAVSSAEAGRLALEPPLV